MHRYSETVKQFILKTPLYIMVFFSMIHLGPLVQINLGRYSFDLSFLNQAFSLMYLAVLYGWALFVNQKSWIKLVSLVMGCLSLISIITSLQDMGYSFNDCLCTGSAILTLLYVFENAPYLLKLVKKHDKLITVGIWFFVGFSIILFTFFTIRITSWGEGTYFFGHRYASVCGLMMILIALKLLNRSKSAWIYWGLLLACYAICFWTGARVYILSGLATMYAILFTFKKGNKDFIFKCVAITLVAVFLFFSSSTATKNTNIVEDTTQKLATEAYQEMDEQYVWVNALSNGRLNMWENCLDSYLDLSVLHKLFGGGNKYMYDHNNGLNSHMDYLNILHYHGVIGMVIYLLLFFGYVFLYWKRNNLSSILLIGFWSVWFILAFLNGYMSYTANMMSVPYFAVLASDLQKKRKNI